MARQKQAFEFQSCKIFRHYTPILIFCHFEEGTRWRRAIRRVRDRPRTGPTCLLTDPRVRKRVFELTKALGKTDRER